MQNFILPVLLFIYSLSSEGQTLLPIQVEDRQNINHIELTSIGDFGLLRKARPGIPAHLHTGMDIKRPSKNYIDEPIYAIHAGTVISKREDGPYAQLILEHQGIKTFWTVYEHISGIEVELFEEVGTDKPIARFMNTQELDRYGWQFDHFHFEILKVAPTRLKIDYEKNPERLYASHTLICYTQSDLEKYFHDPMVFLRYFLDW